VHSVVWEKGVEIRSILQGMAAAGEPSHQAALTAFATRLIGQGQMLVEKQPGMAYALAALALQVGEVEPRVWPTLAAHMKASCCYCIPYYHRKPSASASLEEWDRWKQEAGYGKKADGKTWESKREYYDRMAGRVTMYATLLQQSTYGDFHPPSEEMTTRAAPNLLGTATAWVWLAKVINQAPQRITATLLLAFLQPSAHALAEAYPRQFRKLLSFVNDVYVVKIQAVVDGDSKLAEEQAALSTLRTFVGGALKTLASGRPLPRPTESEMLIFKAPDNTDEAQSDNW